MAAPGWSTCALLYEGSSTKALLLAVHKRARRQIQLGRMASAIETHECVNGLQLITATVEHNPLYSAYVYVPTFVRDNRGLPHTLEHLIFCGSQAFPERGYLDRLATLCQSTGTNAYTSDDHTCYTFNTSSRSGLCRMLPVFLDHIFRPTINEATVKQEVFHRDASGLGRGVVYCEMQGREWSESDQLDRTLRSNCMARSGDPSLDVYRWECGGSTQCIPDITIDAIQQYHQTFYRPHNVTILLCGGPDLAAHREAIIASIEEVHFFLDHGQDGIAVAALDEQELLATACGPFAISSSVSFPASDTSLGSVGLAWMGPPSSECYTVFALHALMRMLAMTSASPLHQHFVERKKPIASDIDYDIRPSYCTMISLIFSGVPCDAVDGVSYLEEGVMGGELFAVIEAFMANDGAITSRLETVIKEMAVKFEEQLEDDPHETIAAYIAPEIVASKWPFAGGAVQNTAVTFGNAIRSYEGYLKRLAGEPCSFWRALLSSTVTQGGATEVRMMPSKEHAEVVKEMERERLAALPMSDEPIEVRPSVPFPIPPFAVDLPLGASSTSSIIPGRGGQAACIETCVLSSTVSRFDLAIEVPTVLERDGDASHLEMLVLLQELLFQCNLDFGSTGDGGAAREPPPLIGRAQISYQELVELFSSTFTSFEGSLGYGNGIFSVGYFDSHFVITLHGRVSLSREELHDLARCILEYSQFDEERVGEVIENLTSQLKEAWREPSAVLDSAILEKIANAHDDAAASPVISTGESSLALAATTPVGNDGAKKRAKVYKSGRISPELYVSLPRQTAFLVEAKAALRSDPAAFLSRLNRLRRALLGSPEIISFGVPSVSAPLHATSCSSEVTTGSTVQPSTLSTPPTHISIPYALPTHGCLEGILTMAAPSGTTKVVEVIPMADITSSYLTMSVPFDLLPWPPTSAPYEGGEGPAEMSERERDRYLCASMLAQLLSYTEGPLYQRIRGGGFAYGAYMSLALWGGLLTFSLSDSTDPARALQAFYGLIRDVLGEAAHITGSASGAGPSGGASPTFLTEETLQTAKAVLMYTFVAGRSTPASIVATAFRAALRGLPPVGSAVEAAWNERILAITLEELAHAALDLLAPFLEDRHRAFAAIAIPAAKVDAIRESFAAVGCDVVVNDTFCVPSLALLEASHEEASDGHFDEGSSEDDGHDGDE